MEGAMVETTAREILIAHQCDSSDNEQGSLRSGPKKRKRKRESLSDAHSVTSCVVGTIPWCIGFCSARVSGTESNDDLSEPSGAFYLVKGYESAATAIVTDSEDDLFFVEESLEFEPPGSESGEDEEEEEDEEDDIISLHTSEDEDPGADGGDEYEAEEDSDSEIDEEDLWMCPRCNTNNHPLSRQCARCWIERHDWLPHLKRSSSEPVDKLSRGIYKPNIVSTLQKSTSLAVAPTVENPGPLLSCLSVKVTTCTASNGSTTPEVYQPPKRCLVEQASLAQPPQTSQTNEQTMPQQMYSRESEFPFEPDLCVICLTQPRNASLVHGRTGHQVCCIGCAEKLKEGKKKCPVCRKKIQLVVKNFF